MKMLAEVCPMQLSCLGLGRLIEEAAAVIVTVRAASVHRTMACESVTEGRTGSPLSLPQQWLSGSAWGAEGGRSGPRW